jgi:hypothetical protein
MSDSSADPTPTAIFVVGAPRSGTTYLQNLLGAHPRVVTSQETDVFGHYVVPLRDRWREQLPEEPDEWARSRHRGLPAVLTEAEFDGLVAGFVARVHEATAELKPGADVVVDKTPQNGFLGEYILRYVPQARFIHIVRDGRDVVTSLLRASRGWGQEWAPGGALRAASQWRLNVEACRGLAHQTDAYLELRYEDLVSEAGPQLLHRALVFCGLEATLEEAAAIHASFDFERGGTSRSSLKWGGEVIRRLAAPPPEPKGFSGEGGVGAWTTELELPDRVAVRWKAGDLLTQLGYASSRAWVGGRRPERWSAWAAMGADALVRRTRRRLARALEP